MIALRCIVLLSMWKGLPPCLASHTKWNMEIWFTDEPLHTSPSAASAQLQPKASTALSPIWMNNQRQQLWQTNMWMWQYINVAIWRWKHQFIVVAADVVALQMSLFVAQVLLLKSSMLEICWKFELQMSTVMQGHAAIGPNCRKRFWWREIQHCTARRYARLWLFLWLEAIYIMWHNKHFFIEVKLGWYGNKCFVLQTNKFNSLNICGILLVYAPALLNGNSDKFSRYNTFFKYKKDSSSSFLDFFVLGVQNKSVRLLVFKCRDLESNVTSE